MIGWDFLVFWQIGEAVLKGMNPYAVEFSRYPPAATLFFALFALVPYLVAFGIWSGVSLVLYIDTLRRMGKTRQAILGWIFFTPTIFTFLTGQIDILFLWLGVWLTKGGWKAIAAGALLTLKPQLAVVIMPWFLIRWLMKDRPLLLKWAGVTLGLHLLPLLLDGEIYGKWITALSGVSEMKVPLSSGLFSLTAVNVPVVILGMVALGLALWGLTRDEATSRAALMLSNPLTIWYDDILLAGLAPVKVIVPFSWVMFGLAYFLNSSIPLALIPLAVLIWKVLPRKLPINEMEGITGG